MTAAAFNTWEMAIRGDVRPKMVPESRQTYAGERPSMLSFFFQFPEIIFRWRGSVIPYVLIEIFLAVGLSFLALYACPDEKFSPVGHQLVGVLLAFLVVFRSQISWGMYMEGRNHVGALFATSRVLAIQMMEDFASAGGSTSENADFASKIHDAEDSLRLLKLYFYLVVEHVRSTDGFNAWQFAQSIAYSFATEAEVAWFDAEYGPVQGSSSKAARKCVLPVPLAPRAAVERRSHSATNEITVPCTAKAVDMPGGQIRSRRLEARSRDWREMLRSNDGKMDTRSRMTGLDLARTEVAPQDPTQSKPLVCLLWLRLSLRKLERFSGEFDKSLNKLILAFNGIDKVDKMVLPLPYSQLIKIFNASWVFSLPFVIVNECGVLTPFVMSLIAVAFFGLDQIGAELEGPFGVDDNDLPLLQMGISLFDNLDALMRAAAEKAKQAKQASSMAA